jgi:hypothetical protein
VKHQETTTPTDPVSEEVVDDCLRQGLEWHDELLRTRQALAAANALIGEAADEARRLQDQIDSLEGALEITVKRHDTQLKEAHRNGLEQAARHVENHSCVSSCCDAQPSAGEARSLADCIRRIQVLTPQKITVQP